MKRCYIRERKIAVMFIIIVLVGILFIPMQADAASNLSKPGQVKGLMVIAKGSNAIEIKFKQVTAAKGYKVYQATQKNGKYILVKTLKGNKSITYIKQNLKAGTKYYYKVRAYKIYKKGKTTQYIYGKYSVAKGATTATNKTWEKLENISILNCNSERFKKSDSIQRDTFGNLYSTNNLFEMSTYGESIWGEYGYSSERLSYGEFNLANSYVSLSGKVAVSDKTESAKDGARLEIYGDGKLLQFYDLNRKTVPFNINLDVSGIRVLKFNLVYRAEDSAGSVYVLLKDMILKKGTGNSVKDPTTIKLSELPIINWQNKYNVITDHTRTDWFGSTYSPENLIELSVYGESIWGNNGYSESQTPYAEYYINNKYKTLTGKIAISDRTVKNVGGKFVVYGDGNKIYSKNLSKTSIPEDVKISLVGYQWLKFTFEFYAEDNAGWSHLYMSDFELQ